MKTYYLVTGNDIKVKNEDGSLNNLAKDDILGTLDYTPSDAKDDEAYIVFDNLETAVQVAIDDQEAHPKEAFPIMMLRVKDDANLINIKVDKEFNEVARGGFKAIEVLANKVEFISASLKHYSPEIADVVFDADLYKEVQAANAPAVDPAPAEPANPEQPAQTASKLGAFLDILKKMSPVFAIGTVGAGFWGSGAIPGVANLVSNIIGVTIPMVGTAGIISQVAIAAAVGALAYGAALGAWTVGKAAYNAGSTALANRKAAKSAKAQYEADKSAAAKDVS
ncbi:MAG: hypothetical protein AB7V32_07225, partial [Candidatus Berkiella sp.]